MAPVTQMADAKNGCNVDAPKGSRSCAVCKVTEGRPFLQAPDRFHGRKELYQLLKCPSCSFVWLDAPPRPEEMERHYGSDYDRLIAEAGERSPGRWQDRRKTLAELKTGGALLDLGCSSGSFLQSMKGKPWTLHGIEISPSVAKTAEERTGAQIFVGDVLAAPFAPSSFDVVTCFHVYEHVYEPVKVMAKVQEWLKPGGIFYFLVPNIDSAAAKVFGSYWYGLEMPRHLSHYSPNALRAIGKAVGLEELSIITRREPHIEYSSRYLLDAGLQKLGITRAPMAQAKPVSLPWRVVRKAYRLSILPVLSGLVALAGDGESIHALFRKPV
jgi:SAM-dependent methyltransferase